MLLTEMCTGHRQRKHYKLVNFVNLPSRYNIISKLISLIFASYTLFCFMLVFFFFKLHCYTKQTSDLILTQVSRARLVLAQQEVNLCQKHFESITYQHQTYDQSVFIIYRQQLVIYWLERNILMRDVCIHCSEM